MNANALRSILLVKSVEDHDPDGSVLSLAEREAATRDALRRHPAGEGDAQGQAPRVLAERATVLQARLAERHPVVTRALDLESRLAASGGLLLLVAFAAGALLSLLDSRVRIEILAFPLLGVVAWNFVVYGVLLYAALRPGRRRDGGGLAPAWTLWPARWGWQRATRLIRQSTFYHRPLAAALRKFSADWWPLAQPMLSLQGQRLFHLGSVAIALGLVAGFYVRGIALEYRAGWESTFLGPEQVRSVLGWIYGPASVATGIELPRDAAAIDSLHWRDGRGGGPAGPWIHLMAATAILYVVVPRLLLALWSTLRLAGARKRCVPPDWLAPYARAVLAGSNAALPAQSVRLTAFAYQPGAASEQGVQRLLRAAFGPDSRIDFAPVLPYGAEAGHDTPSRGPPADIEVVLFSLAATPEAENHGSVLQQARIRQERAAAGSRLLILVDESPYVARMGGDASLAGRVEQRRAAWKDFVRAHGLEACSVDLAALSAAAEVARDDVERVQRGCRTRLA